MSKKFEGVPSDNEAENESAEENDEEQQEHVDSDWTAADYISLMEHLRLVVPRKDIKKPTTTLRRIDWERVAFDGRTADEVKACTLNLIAKLRKHRSLREMIEDIPKLVEKSETTRKPKNPLSAYNFFTKLKFSQFKEKHSELPTHALLKLVYHEFTNLPEKKKQKYIRMAKEAKEEHTRQMEQYYRDNPEVSKKKQKGTKKQSYTPFALFRREVANASEDITEIRTRWNTLQVKDKLKYIQQAFHAQTADGIPDNKVKLTKEEMLLMEYSKGKPLPIAKSTSEYYLKNYAEAPDPGTSLVEWRKQNLMEYKNLPKVRKLELEIEYRQRKQDYVSSYEKYIESMTDKKAQQAEIDQLKSFIQKKLDKDDRQQLPDDSRPYKSLLNSSQTENEIMCLPIAESTVLVSAKKSKKAAPPKAPVADANPPKKPLKSILKSPAKATAEAPTFVAPAVPPKSKRKHSSMSENDSDSNSEKRSKSLIVPVPIVEPALNTSKRTGDDADYMSKEPVRPPSKILDYYKTNHYLGKDENCAESFKKLSSTRKEALRLEMRAAQQKYFRDLQKFLKIVPQSKIRKYIAKMKQAQIDFGMDDTTDERVGKKTPKREPSSSSGSSSSSESDSDENNEDENDQNGANDSTDDDADSNDDE